MRRPGQQKVVGPVLGAIGLVVFVLLAEESFGYGALGGVVIVGALAIGLYAIKSRSMTNRT